MKKMEGIRTIVALLLAFVMVFGSALAGTYDVQLGDVYVHATETDQTVKHGENDPVSDLDPTITGTTTEHTVTIETDANATAQVTFEDLNIDVSGKDNTPAVETTGAGDVGIELEGDSTIKSGDEAAGLQKENTGELTINDADNDGSLAATGGVEGAGIGGGSGGNGEDITINGGEVTAVGGVSAGAGSGGGAGIGGGFNGNGENIIINGGEVNANGRSNSAGIGGGEQGYGRNITINDGTVTANGNYGGAGIGGGYGKDGTDITINDGTVSTVGGLGAAGIGGGREGNGENITINDGKVNVVGGANFAGGYGGGSGIGGGYNGNGESIVINDGEVTVNGGYNGAAIGGGDEGYGKDITINNGTVNASSGSYASGIGGGFDGNGENIVINGGEVTAIGHSGGAGIGGGDDGNGKNITINDGKVTATSEWMGAGIGGGYAFDGENIVINGGEVIATGGNYAAGIGGGICGNGKDITINGGKVTATGGYEEGAGIGGGQEGNGGNITINGGEVIATGGKDGAGIGGGYRGVGGNITINGGEVTATGGDSGAGIGGGRDGNGSNIKMKGDAGVIAVGGGMAAGIGGGRDGTGTGIRVSQSAKVAAAGGEGKGDFSAGAAIGNGGNKNTAPENQDVADKENFYKNGSVKYYPAGTTGEEISNGTVNPVQTITATKECPSHEWEGGDCWILQRCSICGVAKPDSYVHTHGDSVQKTEVAATCLEGGTDYIIVYCSKCDRPYSTTPVETKPLGHDFGEWKQTKAPTCVEKGEEQRTCRREGCGAVEKRDVAAKGHTQAAPVKENEKAAQVGVAGSYDEVVYCKDCGAELSRKTVTVPALPEPEPEVEPKPEPQPEPEPEPEPALASTADPFTEFCDNLARKIRNAPENGTVEADAGNFDGLLPVVFQALEERSDVSLKLQTKDGVIEIPAGAHLLSKISRQGTVTFAEIKGLV